LIVLLAIAGLFLWLFADALFGGGMFAFRDAAHFYYPLFEFIRGEWAAGRVPLWNPYENLGQPLAADATSSVFYPGKLIFALPLSYAWAYKMYILGHVLLAATAAYTLARHWQASIAAAGVCALSYAFSGNVLFDYCNVVFLVGAAWLPVAMLAAERMLVEKSPRWAIAFGIVLALMVLGGDPQMAYNAGLLAAGYAALLWWHDGDFQRQHRPLSLWERVRVRARSCLVVCRLLCRALGAAGVSPVHETKHGQDARGTQGSEHTAIRPHPDPLPEGEGTEAGPHPSPLPKGEGTEIRLRQTPRLVLLALAAATGLLLSAIQVLPSLELAHYSNRHPGPPIGRLLGWLEPESHLDNVYRFSVGPWRLAEYLWPNIAGRQFPVSRRWLDVLPAEGHPWTPSLYMGLLPLLLALSSIRLRRAAPREIWLCWSVLWAVAASFGWYGVGWLWHEIRAAGGASDFWPVGPPLGGLYWFMTLVLPGYVYFRYPAKLLVIAALGLSVLAAWGWDRAFAGESLERLRRWLLSLGGLSLCGAAAALLIRPLWPGWLAQAQPDKLFGPLDAAGACRDLLAAFVQTAVLCGLFWCLLQRGGRGDFSRETTEGSNWFSAKNRPVPFFAPALALLLVAADLAVANAWLVVCAPARLWEERSAMATAIEHAEAGRQVSPRRVYRHPLWTPPAWQAVSSAARPAEAVQWDRDTLWPKYNLSPRIALADVPGTMMLNDYARYLAGGGDVKQICQSVAAEYAILPGDQTLPGGQRIQVGAEDVSLWRCPGPAPRVWIAHDVEQEPPLPLGEGRGEGASDQSGHPGQKTPGAIPLTLTLSQRERGPDAITLSQRERGPGAIILSQREMGPGDWCRVSYYDPLRVEIEARLTRPGLVVLADQFYPGWQLEVQTKGQGTRRVPIERAKEVMRAARLPAGEHRLVYRYRPASFLWGALLSGLGWTGLAGWGIAWCLRLGSGVGSLFPCRQLFVWRNASKRHRHEKRLPTPSA
jgi:hypothetical protein